MDYDYAQSYTRLYREHWWWRAREEFLWKVIHELPLPENPKILDIGCGNGLFFDRLSSLGGTVEGLESDCTLLPHDSVYRHQIHIGPFDRTFAPNKKYSLVLMLDVLEHLENPEESLQKAVELLEPSGLLVLTVPAFRCLWTRHDDLNHHYTRYTKSGFRRMAKSAKFQIDRCQYFFHWLVPLKMAVRAKEIFIRADPAPPGIPARWVNQVFLSISQIEQSLFDHCPLPIGSSMLAVGGRRLS
jgi:2-polyprenyl-3-methyl-5-hydroxy-6-metoxy-1,4-benzoquinol methylase